MVCRYSGNCAGQSSKRQQQNACLKERGGSEKLKPNLRNNATSLNVKIPPENVADKKIIDSTKPPDSSVTEECEFKKRKENGETSNKSMFVDEHLRLHAFEDFNPDIRPETTDHIIVVHADGAYKNRSVPLHNADMNVVPVCKQLKQLRDKYHNERLVGNPRRNLLRLHTAKPISFDISFLTNVNVKGKNTHTPLCNVQGKKQLQTFFHNLKRSSIHYCRSLKQLEEINMPIFSQKNKATQYHTTGILEESKTCNSRQSLTKSVTILCPTSRKVRTLNLTNEIHQTKVTPEVYNSTSKHHISRTCLPLKSNGSNNVNQADVLKGEIFSIKSLFNKDLKIKQEDREKIVDKENKSLTAPHYIKRKLCEQGKRTSEDPLLETMLCIIQHPNGFFPSETLRITVNVILLTVYGISWNLFERKTMRVASFANYPPSAVQPAELLASSGFVYVGNGINDKVKCVFCLEEKEAWQEQDNVDEVHMSLSPSCPMMIVQSTNNVSSVMSLQGARDINQFSSAMPCGFESSIWRSLGSVQRTPQLTYQQLGIFIERPKYPEYAFLARRLESFEHWPEEHPIKKEDLAKAGLYFAGYGDNCKCFFCGGGLRNLDDEIDPLVEHARWFGKCGFIRLYMGHNFVAAVQTLKKYCGTITFNDVAEYMLRKGQTLQYLLNERRIIDDEAVKSLIDAGHNPEAVTRAATSLRESGELLSADGVLRKMKEEMSGASAAEAVISNTASNNDTPEDEPLKDLREQNNALRNRWICKICMDKEVRIVFLPCGHLISCEECGIVLNDCPVCRRFIRARARTTIT